MSEGVKCSEVMPSKSSYMTRQSMFTVATTMLLLSIGGSITNISLPTLSTEFQVSGVLVSWIVVAYLIAGTSLVLGAGALGDKFGKKKLFLFGICVFGIASCLCALSQEFWALVFFRSLQGIGAAFIVSQSLAIAASHLPEEKTGAAMGLLATMAAIGTGIGPAVGGLILASLEWQYMFWLLTVLSIIACVASFKFVPNEKPKEGLSKRLDVFGLLLLVFSCFLYALSMGSGEILLGVSNLWIFIASIGCFGLFLKFQQRTSIPIFNPSLLDNSVRNVTLLVNIFVDAVAMSTLVVGPFFLIYSLGLDTVTVGILMSTGPAIAALSGFPSGKLVDHLGVNAVMIMGLTLMMLGAISLSKLPVYFGVPGYLISLLFITPGRQLYLASNHTFVMTTVPKDSKGAAGGLLNQCKTLGLVTGASFINGIFLTLLESKDVATVTRYQLNSAFSSTYIIIASLIVLAALSILFVARKEEGGKCI